MLIESSKEPFQETIFTTVERIKKSAQDSEKPKEQENEETLNKETVNVSQPIKKMEEEFNDKNSHSGSLDDELVTKTIGE